MLDDILKDAAERMKKSVESLQHDLLKVRTGRANTSLLDHLTVEYYGNPTPLNQVASIAVADARMLTVTPWEKNMVAPIEKAIMSSDLGLNPSSAGTTIRIPMPPLTEDRRRELVKMVRGEGEHAKVAIRNIRRDANHSCKELLKEKMITEDEEHGAEDQIQKLTNRHTDEIDQVLEAKEAELMEV